MKILNEKSAVSQLPYTSKSRVNFSLMILAKDVLIRHNSFSNDSWVGGRTYVQKECHIYSSNFVLVGTGLGNLLGKHEVQRKYGSATNFPNSNYNNEV